MERALLKLGGLQPHSPTLSIAYDEASSVNIPVASVSSSSSISLSAIVTDMTLHCMLKCSYHYNGEQSQLE